VPQKSFSKIQALPDQHRNALLGVTAKHDSGTVTGTLKALQTTQLLQPPGQHLCSVPREKQRRQQQTKQCSSAARKLVQKSHVQNEKRRKAHYELSLCSFFVSTLSCKIFGTNL